MNRFLLTLILISALIADSFGQQSVRELTSSPVYVNYHVQGEDILIHHIALKEILSDTIIQGQQYQKIKWTTFRDMAGEKKVYYEYEHLVKRRYKVLDGQLRIIHDLVLENSKKQKGVIFGKKGKIQYRRMPGDEGTEAATAGTPIVFFVQGDCEKLLVYRPYVGSVELAQDCSSMTKHMIDDVVFQFAKGLQNTTPLSGNYQLSKGDEVQLLYRNRRYNDNTGQAEVQNKEIRSFVYTGDTLLNGTQQMIISADQHHYRIGRKTATRNYYISLKDSGFTIDGEIFVAARDIQPELRVHTSDVYIGGEPLAMKFLYMQSCVYDQVGGKNFPRVIYRGQHPYTRHVLLYFPLMYTDSEGEEAIITFVRHQGKNYGTKLEPQK